MYNENTINEYLALISAFMKISTDANVDAVEAFEEAHPGIGDATYQAAGPMSYDLQTGVVYSDAQQ